MARHVGEPGVCARPEQDEIPGHHYFLTVAGEEQGLNGSKHFC